MTTTAHEDQFTPSTQTIEPVRHPYSTEAILRRNIADMEVALRTQTERAEAAEAELAQQKSVAWMDAEGDTYKEEPPENWCPPHVPLYASFAHTMHKGATHCDDCGLTWLDDGLNPLGCPYCKNHASERNARRYLALRKGGVHVPGYEFVKFDRSLDAAADRLVEGGE